MAGIGFLLRKLIQKDDLFSLFRAYFHSMMASAGPWLVTIIALGSFFLLSRSLVSNESYIAFRLVIMFNFSLSLVIAAPITNCSTRYLADLIYTEELKKASGLMVGMLLIIFCLALPFCLIYYIFFTIMPWDDKFQAILNFMLITSIWHAAIFISALKYYKVITLSFILGMLLSVACAIYFASSHSIMGMLLGFNIGLGYILASLIALVFLEYPPYLIGVFKVISYFKKYWEVALGFFLYAAGLWVDKWMMWFAPESVVLPNLMRMYPYYDSAMFISYLTAIPAMAAFLLVQETAFYETYFKFYQGIQNHDNLVKIRVNFANMMRKLKIIGRDLLLLQTFVAIISIISAPYMFQKLGINLIEIGIFRMGVLGASFQILSLFITVILSYLDYRKGVLIVQAFFFISNFTLTAITMRWGFAFYGYGFFLSSLATFLLSAIILERYIHTLPYHTFVTQNIRTMIRKE